VGLRSAAALRQRYPRSQPPVGASVRGGARRRGSADRPAGRGHRADDYALEPVAGVDVSEVLKFARPVRQSLAFLGPDPVIEPQASEGVKEMSARTARVWRLQNLDGSVHARR